MSEISTLNHRKNAIDMLIQRALYCLNLESDYQRKELESFLNTFFSMQGPEFFLQLEDEKTQKSYAGAMCEFWHFFQNQLLDVKVSLNFYDHPYNKDQTFLSIVSKDCSYILTTVYHIIKKHNLKIKNIMHPVLHIQRDNQGKFLKFFDPSTLKKDDSYGVESVIHFLIVNPLTDVQKEHLRLTIEKSFIELYLIEEASKQLQEKTAFVKSEIAHYHEEEIFLNWLKNGRYYFYGYRYFKKNMTSKSFFLEDENKTLGLLTIDSLKNDDHLAPFCDENLDQPIVRVYKSSLRSNINRGSRYDCIEIPSVNEAGSIVGFHQFIGVFTPDFFESSSLHAPLARIRAKKIFKQFKYDPNWYNGKLLSMIMDSISLDLFFQLDNTEISDICQRVLEIQNGVVAYIKPNKDDDYVLILVFMPAKKYSFAVKEQIKAYLEQTLNGVIYSEHILIGEYPFARLVFVIDRHKDLPAYFETSHIQKQLSIITQTWEENLEKSVDSATVDMISDIFPKDYKQNFDPSVAVLDFNDIKTLSDEKEIVMNVQKDNHGVRLHVFNTKNFVPLSSILSILERFGQKVIFEKSYTLNYKGHSTKPNTYLQILYLEQTSDTLFFDDLAAKERFLETLLLVWQEKIKDDKLNKLVLTTSLNYRDLMLVRLFCRVLCQVGIPYSFDHILETLSCHQEFTQKIIRLFNVKFSPIESDSVGFINLKNELEDYCNALKKVDEDRILRRILNLIEASLRTNFFQKKQDGHFKAYISVKFNSHLILNLPNPKPLYEIFVYSTHTEGVHLRAGKVARGGIRWSDRLEDFRSEVLGLVKSQTVKNSVIVPLGAKGGFVAKHYEKAKDQGLDHHTLKSMVVDSYKTFIMGLLDITDNIVQGEIIKPKDCICYDDDDPYLVVAADKGTATFSDIANELSNQYNFWLGDAFASGGSRGYDHKKMAITARGAWVSAKHHFLEKNIDIQKDSITVIGIGDMAGDVFGNGMLQSDKIKLVAAFNHEHIFLDPNPNAQVSFDERKRLFKMPGSKWSDYNKNLISIGGGVWSRQEKSITLSDDMCLILNIKDKTSCSAEELIKMLLKAPVDLLFFGGIGTFIKSQNESDQDVKDRLNDALRINGYDVGAKVIVEGANLGVTQKGRIEYALNGGRINMDAVDNSAGVDCSDHEVNIKIFFNYLKQNNLLNMKKRDEMLSQMTDNVAELVLKDNKDQTFLLSILESSVFDYTERYKNLIVKLSKSAFLPLDATVEFLPTVQDLSQRHAEQKSFTRPELAILISYTKLHLYQELLNNFDTLFYEKVLYDYFPKIIVSEFKEHLKDHPLKNEIIVTAIANDIINHLGISFIYEISQALDLSHVEIVQHILILFDLLKIKELFNDIKANDSLTEAEKYSLWNKLIQLFKKSFFAYVRNTAVIENFNFEEFEAFMNELTHNAFLDETNTNNLIHKKMNMIRFAPIGIELYQNYITKKLDKAHVLSVAKEIGLHLDFQFLIHLIESSTIHHEWERDAYYLLADDLFKTMAKIMINNMASIDEKLYLLKHRSLSSYHYHKDLAKIALQQDQNAIALIAYLTRQLKVLMEK
ncbi:MAG: NAD-glutamate dehydrogenase [Proteobacteria bacterium]|nr:NAD-glutamate dehydrogenase [Pseudomonadota bacterium]